MILLQLDIKIKGSVSRYATKICMGGSENHECQNCFCNVVKSQRINQSQENLTGCLEISFNNVYYLLRAPSNIVK